MDKYYDVIIVGAGLSGATMAEHCARAGASVLVIDKRSHIGGNVYDKVDEDTGIRISLYGAHLFHTNDSEIWDYVQRFGTWVRWDHSVVADVGGVMVPLPININTVNTLYNTHITNESEMKAWLQNEAGVGSFHIVKNSKDAAINKCGERIYSTLFEEYTKKQWGRDACDLDPSVLERIPLRANFDNRYFTDRYQALPRDGYTSIVNKMLSNPLITVSLGVSWSDFKAITPEIKSSILIFTGPIDTYFDNAGLPLLEYRSINFEWRKMPCMGYQQIGSVVNYPSADNKYTRSVEYKHFLNQPSQFSIISYETTCDSGEPYYPIPNCKNLEIYEKYKKLSLAELQKGIHFIGRLASYKYFNMDQAIRASIDYFRKFIDIDLSRIIQKRH